MTTFQNDRMVKADCGSGKAYGTCITSSEHLQQEWKGPDRKCSTLEVTYGL